MKHNTRRWRSYTIHWLTRMRSWSWILVSSSRMRSTRLLMIQPVELLNQCRIGYWIESQPSGVCWTSLGSGWSLELPIIDTRNVPDLLFTQIHLLWIVQDWRSKFILHNQLTGWIFLDKTSPMQTQQPFNPHNSNKRSRVDNQCCSTHPTSSSKVYHQWRDPYWSQNATKLL